MGGALGFAVRASLVDQQARFVDKAMTTGAGIAVPLWWALWIYPMIALEWILRKMGVRWLLLKAGVITEKDWRA